MRYGIDVSNYSGEPSVDALRSVVDSQNIDFIIIACQFADTYFKWVSVAEQVGILVEAYRYLYNVGSTLGGDGSSYEQQVLDAQRIIGATTHQLYLDCEDETGTLPGEFDIDSALRQAEQFHTPGIYTRQDYWQRIGNPQFGNRVKLWVANWDNNDSGFDVNFGGWLKAQTKQYNGSFSSYGLQFGLDSRES